MAFGPGKYDDLCTHARLQAKADGAFLIIFGGPGGGGFACQASPEVTAILPAMLEDFAAQIREDLLRNTTLRALWWENLGGAERDYWNKRGHNHGMEGAWASFVQTGGRKA